MFRIGTQRKSAVGGHRAYNVDGKKDQQECQKGRQSSFLKLKGLHNLKFLSYGQYFRSFTGLTVAL